MFGTHEEYGSRNHGAKIEESDFRGKNSDHLFLLTQLLELWTEKLWGPKLQARLLEILEESPGMATQDPSFTDKLVSLDSPG